MGVGGVVRSIQHIDENVFRAYTVPQLLLFTFYNTSKPGMKKNSFCYSKNMSTCGLFEV